jgi:hypothetical protein
LYLRVIVQAQAALRDLRYFFLTNNLRFVKTFLQMRIEAVLLQTWKLRNHQIRATFYLIYSNLHRIFEIFVFMCYSTSTRSSAGSQIFSWQTIWDLSKLFCRWESELSLSKYAKSENRHIWAIFFTFCPFHVNILNFSRFPCYGTSTVSEIFQIRNRQIWAIYLIFCPFYANIL